MAEVENYTKKLEDCRRSIDRLDTILIYTLGERFKQTEIIGNIKAKAKLPSSDKDRVTLQKQRLEKLASDANLDGVFAEKLLDLIINEVIKNHDKIKSDTGL